MKAFVLAAYVALVVASPLSNAQQQSNIDVATFTPAAVRRPEKWHRLGDTNEETYYYTFYAKEYRVDATLKIAVKDLNGGYSTIELDDEYIVCPRDGSFPNTIMAQGRYTFSAVNGGYLGAEHPADGVGDDMQLTPGTVAAALVKAICPIVARAGGTINPN